MRYSQGALIPPVHLSYVQRVCKGLAKTKKDASILTGILLFQIRVYLCMTILLTTYGYTCLPSCKTSTYTCIVIHTHLYGFFVADFVRNTTDDASDKVYV